MTEAQLETKLVTFCREHGLLTYKFASPSHRGVPDRIIMHDGRILFVELKRPGNKPTELQLREIERIKANGVAAIWADDWHRLTCYLIGFFLLNL